MATLSGSRLSATIWAPRRLSFQQQTLRLTAGFWTPTFCTGPRLPLSCEHTSRNRGKCLLLHQDSGKPCGISRPDLNGRVQALLYQLVVRKGDDALRGILHWQHAIIRFIMIDTIEHVFQCALLDHFIVQQLRHGCFMRETSGRAEIGDPLIFPRHGQPPSSIGNGV